MPHTQYLGATSLLLSIQNETNWPQSEHSSATSRFRREYIWTIGFQQSRVINKEWIWNETRYYPDHTRLWGENGTMVPSNGTVLFTKETDCRSWKLTISLEKDDGTKYIFEGVVNEKVRADGVRYTTNKTTTVLFCCGITAPLYHLQGGVAIKVPVNNMVFSTTRSALGWHHTVKNIFGTMPTIVTKTVETHK